MCSNVFSRWARRSRTSIIFGTRVASNAFASTAYSASAADDTSRYNKPRGEHEMAATDTSASPPGPQYDPVALTQCFAAAADKSAKLLGDFVARQASSNHSLVSDEFGLTKAFLEL